MQQNVSYARLVTLIVPGVAGTGNTGEDFIFNDQPDIRYARMTGMAFLTDQEMTHAQPQTTPLVAAALMSKISFTFETNDPDDTLIAGTNKKQKGDNGRFTGTLSTIEWMPASLLHVSQSGAAPVSFVRNVIHWKDRYITWQKSHVKIAPGGLANTSDVAICLMCFYTFNNAKNEPIIR